MLESIWTDIFVSWRNVTRHGRRSLASAAAVTIGIVSLMLAAGFIEWIYWGMREGTIHSGLGHIQIVRKGYPERGTADPFSYLLPENSLDRKSVEDTLHVVKVAPRLKFTGLIGLRDSSLSFLGTALDPTLEGGLEDVTVIDSGHTLSDANRTGILLGRGLANHLGAKVGDSSRCPS